MTERGIRMQFGIPHTFEIRDDFYLDDKKIKIISGGMHYFRIVPQYWQDRLEKLKALGCNTVETYIPWNLHEREKGQFDFTGILDIAEFVRTAQNLGLMVILRPTPYICGEWEFGGLPYWLLAEDGIRLRCCNERYLQHVRDYYEKLFEVIAPLQITKGGPVIMMQVENEYGYYGDDHAYLDCLKSMMEESGCEVPMVTSDGPWGDSFACGKADGCLQTGNFGSKAKEQFDIIERIQPERPLMCMEFWVGWFDYWGAGKHATGDIELHAKDLDEILRRGHVNLYMFIGGTNFGFMNGSNYYDELTPDVTSYDYDALLTEDGQLTPKYEAFRKVICKYIDQEWLKECDSLYHKIRKEAPRGQAYGEIAISRSADLFQNLENLAEPVQSLFPQPMEKLGQGYGYILYESELRDEGNLEKIRLYEANDRAVIFTDEKKVMTLYDRELLSEHEFLPPVKKGEKLQILMENMGRVNFGPMLEKQKKGIGQTVTLNGHQHFYWTQYPLPMEDLSKLDYTKEAQEGTPGFYEFVFEAKEAADTFLSLDGWGKGCVIVNGTNIGRFWEKGPQKRLYLPGPLLKQGENRIIVFESEGKADSHITLMSEPDLG